MQFQTADPMSHRPAGTDNMCEAPRTLQLANEGIEDQESPDDASAATLPDAAAAAATTESYNAGAAVRQAALQKLAALQARLNEVIHRMMLSPVLIGKLSACCSLSPPVEFAELLWCGDQRASTNHICWCVC
jgi:hypothetical protein